MPSARELLEQADALMRRNRSRETLSPAMGPRTMAPAINLRTPAPAAGDFPVLTEAMDDSSQAAAIPSAPPATPYGANAASMVMPADANAAPLGAAAGANAAPTGAPAGAEPVTAISSTAAGPVVAHEFPPAAQGSAMPVSSPTMRMPLGPQPSMQPAHQHDLRAFGEPAMRDVPMPAQPMVDDEPPPPAMRAFTDVPVLTDAIEEIDAALIAAAQEGEPSIWNDEAMRGDDSVLGPAPKSIAVIPDSHEIDESHARNARVTAEESAAATATAVAASTAELIEEVRMQVLQRIDMFTDTGLREQLGERLKPIVDRASAELVATINQHVGELLRTYVAEAIERELDRLRNEVR
jgi:hypothetical protein